MEDLDTRLADQVATLSTQLVTEVAKSSSLEETVLSMRKENGRLRQQLAQSSASTDENSQLSEQNRALKAENGELARAKAEAEAKNKQLEGEVEDLTASLFNEANEMVSNASREAYNFKLKNRKLIEELGEKDAIIDNLQQQLLDLKQLIVKLEDEHQQTPQLDSGTFDSPRPETPLAPADEYASQLQNVLFGPRGRSIRFDLPVYQNDFKGFVYQLIKPDFTFDLASLKTLKYFRKIWTEEIEPSFASVPAISGQTFMNRWSKGKSFWNILVEGKAIIEPVAGVNETFKLTYKGAKSGEIPVAVKEPCTFCGESRNDLLEHARLYNLKLYGPTTDSFTPRTDLMDVPHEIIGTYPLSNFCLVKLRAICDFFAKLRLIHSNIHKLKQNSSFDDAAYVSSFQFKRSTDSLQKPVSVPEDEPILIKLHLMLLVLRAKIFWSKVGFWDTDEEIETIKIDDIPLEVFRGIVSENVAFRPTQLDVVESHDERKPGFGARLSKLLEKDTHPIKLEDKETVADDGEKEVSESTEVNETQPEQKDEERGEEKVAEKETEEKETEEKEEVKEVSDEDKEKDVVGEEEEKATESDDNEFQDTSEAFEEPGIQRRKSKSKAFKKKMESDLASTMEMLKENIE